MAAIGLGGWQRLWLVLAGLYAIGIAVYVWQQWPETDSSLIREYTVRDNAGARLTFLYYGSEEPNEEQIAAVFAAEGRANRAAFLQEYRDRYPEYQDLTDEDLLSRTEQAYPGAFKMRPDGKPVSWKAVVSSASDAAGRTVYFPAAVGPAIIQQEVELLNTGVGPLQRRLLMAALMAWLLPQVALGAIIFASVWIARGFREDRNKPTPES